MKNKRKIIYVLVPILIALAIILFRSNNLSKNMDPEIYKKVKAISQKNIYFGHKSVGENIIAGLKKINSDMAQNELIIKELSDTFRLDGNYFVHSNIGQNGDPKGKFEEFESIINNMANKKLDIAMMKLCFVDITKNTNIDDVFNSYVSMIDILQNKYPHIKFIHFTVPLKSKPSFLNSIKEKIKGLNNYDQQDNLARNRYNGYIFSKYSKDDIFDLAGAESTYPDGQRESTFVNGKLCFILIKDYTDDGGHLNDLGKQIISEKLIQKIYESINLPIIDLKHKSFSANAL
jgi:hypothetical protein